MDTVKVSIDKLQLLNDRINQAIDALDDVRRSVHGLEHASAPIGAGVPLTMPSIDLARAAGVPMPVGMGPQPMVGATGLGHTSAASFDPRLGASLDPALLGRCAVTFPYLMSTFAPRG